MVEPALLAQHADAGPVEHGQGGLVGSQIAVVLTGPPARRAPVLEAFEGGPHRGSRLVQGLEQTVLCHAGDGTRVCAFSCCSRLRSTSPTSGR